MAAQEHPQLDTVNVPELGICFDLGEDLRIAVDPEEQREQLRNWPSTYGQYVAAIIYAQNPSVRRCLIQVLDGLRGKRDILLQFVREQPPTVKRLGGQKR